MMNYNDKILDSIKTSAVDEWCDLNPTAEYDGSNRKEGERYLFYKMLSNALMYKTRTIDNLTECVLYLSHRVKDLEDKVSNGQGVYNDWL